MLLNRIVLAVLLIFPVFLYGQDSIYRKNNTVNVCLIQEWNDSIIQYILVEEPDSEMHFLSVVYIDSIYFQNGRVKRFISVDPPEEGAPVKETRNCLGLGLGLGLINHVLYTNLRLSYEHLSGDGSVGLFLPITIGFQHYYDPDSERNLQFRLGLGMNFHVPRMQGPRFYVIGVSINYGRYFNHPVNAYEPGQKSRGFINLTNSHSFHIRLSDRLIFAPGFEIHPIGWIKHYGLEFLYPFPYSLRFDFLVNL
jgi:hypothetical protein